MIVDLSMALVKSLCEGDMLIATMNGKNAVFTKVNKKELTKKLEDDVEKLKVENERLKQENELLRAEVNVFERSVNEKLVKIAKIVGGAE